jgi:hypothetical protein
MHHHRVVHLVDAHRPGDREQQRAEQHDRRDALEHAAQHDEGDDRHRHEAAAPPGSARIAWLSVFEKPDCVSPQAIAVAAPMISRIEPDRLAVSTSIG